MISLWCKCALLSFLAIHVDSSWVDPDTPLEYSTIDPLSPGDQRKYELVCLWLVRIFWILQRESLISVYLEFAIRFSRTSSNKTVEHLRMGKILAGRLSTRTIVRWKRLSPMCCCASVCSQFLSLTTDTNEALHYYSDDNAVTNNGVLNITTEKKINVYKAFNEKTKKFYADKKHVQSAMLQSWNKFCFTGGIVEFSAKMPGNAKTGGLWPARKFYSFSSSQ